jgi:hypothetical protein
MKQLFFTLAAISVPILIFGVVFYWFFRGLYTVFSDWKLGQELKQIHREAEMRRQSMRSGSDSESRQDDGGPGG